MINITIRPETEPAWYEIVKECRFSRGGISVSSQKRRRAIIAIDAEIHQLRAEVERLRAEAVERILER